VDTPDARLTNKTTPPNAKRFTRSACSLIASTSTIGISGTKRERPGLDRALAAVRTGEGMAVARAQGKLKGRQPKLSPKQQRELKRMHQTDEYTISDLGELFSVSRPTVYRSNVHSARWWSAFTHLCHPSLAAGCWAGEVFLFRASFRFCSR
jgi:DNA invertase Pin-like site-specific DNA recombinase